MSGADHRSEAAQPFHLSKAQLIAGSAVLIAGVTSFHWLAHGEYEVAIFDLVPVGLCSWSLGFPAGAIASAVAALALLGVDLAAGLEHYSRPTIPFWNNWMRLATFTLVANLVSRLADSVKKEQEDSDFKSKMLSLVTHEFNHSLTVIGVALSMLKDGAGKDADKRSTVLHTIERQHAILRQLVSNYLNYNRVKQGRLRLHFKPTVARELIEDGVKLLQPLSHQLDIAVELRFPPKTIPVKADGAALSLVLSNLIGNAIKFTPRGGKVTISIAASKRSHGKLRVAIEDTGSGIGKDDQKKIREGVYLTRGASLTGPQGFGLGLRLVEELLRQHESHLSIQSWPGEGTIFSFELPAWHASEEAAKLDEEAAANGRG
jgi:signal transduction histidine kinase